MRYSLRTLLLFMLFGGPLLAAAICLYYRSFERALDVLVVCLVCMMGYFIEASPRAGG